MSVYQLSIHEESFYVYDVQPENLASTEPALRLNALAGADALDLIAALHAAGRLPDPRLTRAWPMVGPDGTWLIESEAPEGPVPMFILVPVDDDAHARAVERLFSASNTDAERPTEHVYLFREADGGYCVSATDSGDPGTERHFTGYRDAYHHARERLLSMRRSSSVVFAVDLPVDPDAPQWALS